MQAEIHVGVRQPDIRFHMFGIYNFRHIRCAGVPQWQQVC